MPDSQSREPRFESPLRLFRNMDIVALSMKPQFTQLYKYPNEYLAIDGGGNASDWSSRINAAWLNAS